MISTISPLAHFGGDMTTDNLFGVFLRGSHLLIHHRGLEMMDIQPETRKHVTKNHMNNSKAALVFNTHEDISHSQVLVHAQNREN